MSDTSTIRISTVSSELIQDWLAALQSICAPEHYRSLLARSNVLVGDTALQGRVTLDQIVALYQRAAVETGDEMMGLWSRPIRPRALQHLLTSVREATSLSSALFRFSTFWNLLLDDYQFRFEHEAGTRTLYLIPVAKEPLAQRFGHMLILKLAHGILSWLARAEVPVEAVDFAFERPSYEEDYSVIFPAPVRFSAVASAIHFAAHDLGPVQIRSTDDLDRFLENAPRDWIFTRSQEHTQSLRVRAFLSQSSWKNAHLNAAAESLHMTPRTLIRKLDADGTSFQSIKDALRRDIAIRRLQVDDVSIEAIAQDVGFASAASFHKAFHRWTGTTPNSYRRQGWSDT
ncbi:MAG: AraC family transcriptional regulator [Marinovum sp.]|nr:AraC family transcriptional regulator [Marinovum sp.]